jgi:protein-tyrosine phosphatase
MTMTKKHKLRILLVCTGNICRSPTAEGVLRAHLERAGLASQIDVDSAGTHGYHVGDPPDERSQAAAARRGYDISGLRARRVAHDDFSRFDLILAMDREHLALLQRSSPTSSRSRLGLFLDYAPNAARDEVPDPYYGGPAGFEHVLDLIEDAAAGLIETLRQEK